MPGLNPSLAFQGLCRRPATLTCPLHLGAVLSSQATLPTVPECHRTFASARSLTGNTLPPALHLVPLKGPIDHIVLPPGRLLGYCSKPQKSFFFFSSPRAYGLHCTIAHTYTHMCTGIYTHACTQTPTAHTCTHTHIQAQHTHTRTYIKTHTCNHITK